MKILKCLCAACLVLAGAAAWAEGSNDPVEAATSTWIKEGGTNSTMITSKRLTYEPDKREAIFEGDVVVVDPEVTITSDTLRVRFSEENKIHTVTAQGSVTITQGERVGKGDEVSYTVADGLVVMTGSPRILDGKNILKADVIRFSPNTSKIVCEPNATLIMYPDRKQRSELKPF